MGNLDVVSVRVARKIFCNVCDRKERPASLPLSRANTITMQTAPYNNDSIGLTTLHCDCSAC